MRQFSKDFLRIDPEKETQKITEKIRGILTKQIKKRGMVVALSGGIDSSTCLALAVKTIGKDKVYGLLMPERHSSDDTLDLSTLVADTFEVNRTYDNISSILESLGFYKRYDESCPQSYTGVRSRLEVKNSYTKCH